MSEIAIAEPDAIDAYDKAVSAIKLLSHDNALLAHLRRSPNLNSPQAVGLWPLLSRLNATKYEQEALFTALKFYSIMTQGMGPSKEKRISLFKALNLLRLRLPSTQSLDRHVKNVLTANNADLIMHNLTICIRLLKQNGITNVDFAKLAKDLTLMQTKQSVLRSICFSWGQQYFYMPQSN